MPLSTPVARKPFHTRKIELNGYAREDGLWDIEARMIDTKHYEFPNRFRGNIQPGEHLHEMWLRLTLDDSMTIRAAEATTEWSPFPSGPGAADSYRKLVGLKIGPGWTDRVKERIASTSGCTHLTELLRPLATVAYQTILSPRRNEDAPDDERRPALLDTCRGWRAEGEAVQQIHPKWNREPGTE